MSFAISFFHNKTIKSVHYMRNIKIVPMYFFFINPHYQLLNSSCPVEATAPSVRNLHLCPALYLGQLLNVIKARQL